MTDPLRHLIGGAVLALILILFFKKVKQPFLVWIVFFLSFELSQFETWWAMYGYNWYVILDYFWTDTFFDMVLASAGGIIIISLYWWIFKFEIFKLFKIKIWK